jgi:hypothetical protein
MIVYTQLTGQDLSDIVRVFDQAGDEKKNSKPVPLG